jgi:hypothetical protein
MTTRDQEYYTRRERQERERAALSADEPVKRLHLELAERYSALLGERTSIAQMAVA